MTSLTSSGFVFVCMNVHEHGRCICTATTSSAPVLGDKSPSSAFRNTKCSCCISACEKQVKRKGSKLSYGSAAASAYHSAAVLGRSTNKLTAVACGNFLLSPDTVRFGHTLCVDMLANPLY